MGKDKKIDEKVKEIYESIVYTDHAVERTRTRRGVSKWDIAEACVLGVKGFAGHKRLKVTYKDLTVLYKIDARGNYVIITFYRKANKNNDLFEKLNILY